MSAHQHIRQTTQGVGSWEHKNQAQGSQKTQWQSTRCKKTGKRVLKKLIAGNERLWCHVNTAWLVCTSNRSLVSSLRGVIDNSFTRRRSTLCRGVSPLRYTYDFFELIILEKNSSKVSFLTMKMKASAHRKFSIWGEKNGR